MGKAVNMAAIAARVGCSVAAVSLALRGSSRVGEARRAEIMRTAKAMGYRPNPLVSALVASRHTRKRHLEVIAVITKFDDPLANWRAPQSFFSPLFDGMLERATELGFLLEEFPAFGAGAPNGKRLSEIFRNRGIHGVILFPGGGLARHYPELDWGKFATVAAAFNDPQLPVHRTAADNAAGMEECLGELQRRGYRRLGLAYSSTLDMRTRYGFCGRFLAWREQQAKGARIPLLEEVEEGGRRAEFVRWVRRWRPDCVLGAESEQAEWLRQEGLRIPEDVGFALVPVRELKGVAGIDNDPAGVGRLTVGLVARELFLNHYGLPAVPESSYLAARWVNGPTVRGPVL
jgi:LacI family transcriptional regulator